LNKPDKLIERAAYHCLRRNPETLDQIFDNLSSKLNKQVLRGTVVALSDGIDTITWLCGYFASEISYSSDNHKRLQTYK
jgi:hypothetical protein